MCRRPNPSPAQFQIVTRSLRNGFGENCRLNTDFARRTKNRPWSRHKRDIKSQACGRSRVISTAFAMSSDYDAIVVGSGPNGLAAAITLARAGLWFAVLESNSTIGGGARSAELTLPDFVHDVCSAVHPLAAGSPFFKAAPLEKFGLKWIQPEIPLAHPLDDGSAACLLRDVDATADSLGDDSRTYCRLMKPLVRDWPKLT